MLTLKIAEAQVCVCTCFIRNLSWDTKCIFTSGDLTKLLTLFQNIH